MLQKIQKIILIEKRRYEQKGLTNILIAVMLLIGIILGSLTIGKMYWPNKVEDKLHFLFIGAFLCHFSFRVITFLFYLPGYLDWSNYYAKYLINKKLTRPWERKNWTEVRNKVFRYMFLNELVIYPVIVYGLNLRGTKLRFDDFPDFKELTAHIIVCFFVEDFFFYWAHRLLHSTPFFYQFHKIHHEIDSLFSPIGEYFHPFEYLICSMIPSAMGFILLGSRVHCFTFFFWIWIKVNVGSENHSGYDFPWSPIRVLPFVFGSTYHDHHHSDNVGNMAGSCYLWDLMLDTNVPYIDKYLKQ